MPLNTTIDLTKVVSTLVSSVEPHTSVLTSYGTLTTNLGTSNTYLTSTVLQTGLQGEQGIQGAEGKSAYEVWITSGNTGTPKGVMLTHKNIISQLHDINKLIDLPKNETSLSLLPLAHIFERAVMSYYLSRGISIYFVDDIQNVANLMKIVKPSTTS